MNRRRWNRARWMTLCVLGCLLPSGCGGTRVVTVPTTEPVQLAEPVKAYVYVQTKDGTRVRGSTRSQLYEGEWVLSDPGDK